MMTEKGIETLLDISNEFLLSAPTCALALQAAIRDIEDRQKRIEELEKLVKEAEVFLGSGIWRTNEPIKLAERMRLALNQIKVYSQGG